MTIWGQTGGRPWADWDHHIWGAYLEKNFWTYRGTDCNKNESSISILQPLRALCTVKPQ